MASGWELGAHARVWKIQNPSCAHDERADGSGHDVALEEFVQLPECFCWTKATDEDDHGQEQGGKEKEKSQGCVQWQQDNRDQAPTKASEKGLCLVHTRHHIAM